MPAFALSRWVQQGNCRDPLPPAPRRRPLPTTYSLRASEKKVGCQGISWPENSQVGDETSRSKVTNPCSEQVGRVAAVNVLCSVPSQCFSRAWWGSTAPRSWGLMDARGGREVTRTGAAMQSFQKFSPVQTGQAGRGSRFPGELKSLQIRTLSYLERALRGSLRGTERGGGSATWRRGYEFQLQIEPPGLPQKLLQGE